MKFAAIHFEFVLAAARSRPPYLHVVEEDSQASLIDFDVLAVSQLPGPLLNMSPPFVFLLERTECVIEQFVA